MKSCPTCKGRSGWIQPGLHPLRDSEPLAFGCFDTGYLWLGAPIAWAAGTTTGTGVRSSPGSALGAQALTPDAAPGIALVRQNGRSQESGFVIMPARLPHAIVASLLQFARSALL